MSYYSSNPANFESGRALTEDEMRQKAPSIFAEDAHDSRSERFVPVPTISILRELQKEGFSVVGAKQSTTRNPDKSDYTKHLVRLRKLDKDIKYSVGDTVFEVLLKNANDGSSIYEMMDGLFRVRCLNSLVAQTADIDVLRVRHSGNPRIVADNVIEGVYSVLNHAETLLAAPQDWGKIVLNPTQRAAYAMAAHSLRFGTETDQQVNDHPIRAHSLLTARRQGDSHADLWTTFNVVQENCLKGGLLGSTPDSTVRRGFRRMTTRPVNGIDQDVKLNKALWLLTAEMARLAA